MLVRVVVSLALLITGAIVAPPSIAEADVAPPPIVLNVEGRRTAHTTMGPADHALYHLRNLSDRALTVHLDRVIAIDGRTNLPVDVIGATAQGRDVGRALEIPARGEVMVTVSFELPRSLHERSRWTLELRVTVSSAYGAVESSPAVVTRATRHRAR